MNSPYREPALIQEGLTLVKPYMNSLVLVATGAAVAAEILGAWFLTHHLGVDWWAASLSGLAMAITTSAAGGTLLK